MNQDNNSFSSPYNFVPLSTFVYTPDWAKQVSQDYPLKDGISGELELEILTKSPLCVGGEQIPASNNQPSKVPFYRTPDNALAIPGSSLKGMLRNVLSIATFGHFSQVEDKRLGVRDISKANNFYSTAMSQPPNAGWLRFEDGQWKLWPCKSQYVRIKHEKIIEHFGIHKRDWLDDKKKTSIDRYKLLERATGTNALQLLTFTKIPYKYDCKTEVEHLNKGNEQGYLVLTGQAGRGFNQPKGKQREFVFPEPGHNSLAISQRVMADFMLIHEESNEWQFWRNKVADIKPGIPVFFYYDTQKNVKSMGLARMYKLAYEYSLHEAIQHTSKAHLAPSQSDLSDVILGSLDSDNGSNSLRGRVNFGLATTDNEPQLHWTAPTVLSSPKPTFYPAYIRQEATGKYKTLMDTRSELAGWKQYPARHKTDHDVPPPPDKSKPSVQAMLETVPADSRFTARLRFHNLRLVELGALLWCLDFGGQKNLRHRLGTGKPLGFGQIQISYVPVKLRANKQSTVADDDWLEVAKVAFSDLMDSIWKQITGDESAQWSQSPQLVQLKAMADPDISATKDLRYIGEPKAFGNIKQKEKRLKPHVEFRKQEPTPKSDTTVSTSDTSLSSLLERVEEVRKEQAAQELQKAEEKRLEEAKAAREAEKSEMSETQRILADTSDLLNQADTGLTATLDKNLTKAFNQIHSERACFDRDEDTLIERLTLRGEELVERENKQNGKLAKSLKKIRRDILA